MRACSLFFVLFGVRPREIFSLHSHQTIIRKSIYTLYFYGRPSEKDREAGLLAPVFNFATAKNRLLFDDLARCFRGYPVVFLIGFLNWLEEKVLLGLVATLISILVNSSLKDFAIFPTSGF